MADNDTKKFLTAAIIMSLVSGFAFAQAGHGTGRVTGAVLDQYGKPVPGAKVILAFEAGKGVTLETATDKKGVWGFIGLGTGNWQITVSAPGYIAVTTDSYISQLKANERIVVKLEKQATGGGLIQDESSFADLEQGNEFFKSGRYDSALTMYEEFLKKNPQAYQVYLNIGDCHMEKGDLEKAMESYNHLIDKAKDDTAMGKAMTAKGLAAIGQIHLKKDDIPTAQEFFKRSIEVAPQDELLPYNVAEIYFSNQQLDEAREYFEIAAAIKPQWPDPYIKLAYVHLNTGELDKAAGYLEKFLELEPGDSARAAQAKTILESIKKF